MALSNEQARAYSRRLLMARSRLLVDNGFYGLLLMHMIYSLDEGAETAYTDGDRIAFSPKFMEELSDKELEFVLMHEILHVVLRHCARGKNYDPFLFNIACDIVVNSNIMHSNCDDKTSITLKKYGESMHLTPSGEEGYKFTAEEVYEQLLQQQRRFSECQQDQ
jgi:predicted metal-dependent peptidase